MSRYFPAGGASDIIKKSESKLVVAGESELAESTSTQQQQQQKVFRRKSSPGWNPLWRNLYSALPTGYWEAEEEEGKLFRPRLEEGDLLASGDHSTGYSTESRDFAR